MPLSLQQRLQHSCSKDVRTGTKEVSLLPNFRASFLIKSDTFKIVSYILASVNDAVPDDCTFEASKDTMTVNHTEREVAGNDNACLILIPVPKRKTKKMSQQPASNQDYVLVRKAVGKTKSRF